MSDNMLRKTYTIMVTRTTGAQMELGTATEYAAAMALAKEALNNNNNIEVRVIENKYDDATHREKKQVVKILNRNNLASAQNAVPNSRSGPKVIPPEVVSRATKSVINIALAFTVLILLGGIIFQLIR
jgi:Na+-translocating ferredoxin:NAD+ oxidoreductase RnfC subunit